MIHTNKRKSGIYREPHEKPIKSLVSQLECPLTTVKFHLEDIYTTSTNAIRRPINISVSLEMEVRTSQVHAYRRYEYIAKREMGADGAYCVACEVHKSGIFHVLCILNGPMLYRHGDDRCVERVHVSISAS